MKNSFLSTLAGWLAGAITFGMVGGRLAGGDGPGWTLVSALYSAPFVLVVWLVCLWPLYVFVPSRSFAWRPLICVPAGALAGALLYFGVVGSAFDWQLRGYFATRHVFVGAVVGAVTCAVGVALHRRDTRAA